MRLSLLDKEGVWTWARRTCSAAPAQPGLPEPLALGFCATRAATARQLQVDANPATHGPGRPRGAHPYLHFYKSHCQTVKCILPSQTALDLLRIGTKITITNIIRCLHISKSLQIKCLTIVLGWRHYNNNALSCLFSKWTDCSWKFTWLVQSCRRAGTQTKVFWF